MSATCGLKCVWYPVGYRWRIFRTTMQIQPDSVNYFGHLLHAQSIVSWPWFYPDNRFADDQFFKIFNQL